MVSPASAVSDHAAQVSTLAGSELPPLTPAEFRIYDRMAVRMNAFHDHFRSSWNMLYNAASSGRRPEKMTLRQFIDEGINLVRYLETHHSIEETYIFPLLARKMPEFKSGTGSAKNGAAELLRQHQEIHAGMDIFADYLSKCRSGEEPLELSIMRGKMDTWGPVLLRHLDQEVESLGANNMRKYWTQEEMRSMPM